jgi:single-strand DNA-binding protein
MALPTISLQGNLTGDPELRTTASGKYVVSLRVACNDRKKDQTTGEWVDGDTLYLDVVSWKNAEAINNTLGRGAKVLIVGTLKQREYETKDGQKRTVYEVNADHVAQIVADKFGGPASITSIPASDPWASTPVAEPANTSNPDPWGNDPDVPF